MCQASVDRQSTTPLSEHNSTPSLTFPSCNPDSNPLFVQGERRRGDNPIIGIIVLGSHSAFPHNTANNNGTANSDDGTADNGNDTANSDNGTMASSARTPTPMVRRRRRREGESEEEEEEEEDSGGLRIPREGEEDAEEDAPTSRPPTNIEFRVPLEDERRYKFIASFIRGRKLNWGKK